MPSGLAALTGPRTMSVTWELTETPLGAMLGQGFTDVPAVVSVDPMPCSVWPLKVVKIPPTSTTEPAGANAIESTALFTAGAHGATVPPVAASTAPAKGRAVVPRVLNSPPRETVDPS